VQALRIRTKIFLGMVTVLAVFISTSVLVVDRLAIVEAGAGRDALRASEQHEGRIDLLLADVVMPQLSGPELAQRLEEERPGIKILFMSGYADEAVFKRSGLASGETLMQKPFTPEALLGKIREMLDG
jgi:two-component system cell cycle sensor histidine kinase/response regulator CckA